MALCPSYNLSKKRKKKKEEDKAQVYLSKDTKFGGQVIKWEGVRHPFRPDRFWTSRLS